ncbi:MAG: hypothetical protein REI95_03645 [Oxalicibacterium faecigallinarum]|nr:hypothetical protein [Oxalicibacterium faecigallinarum]MDQ7968715.1 hypothetical protein [Oxalicibacterium faecigallinarum]
MRKFSTIGLISAAAAVSFLCAAAVHSDDLPGHKTIIVAESR